MPLLDADGLARTYSHPSYDDSASAVADYDRVMAYHDEHPDEGSYIVANELDLPRSRVRKWLDGGRPDPVRAVDVAREHGWLDPVSGGETEHALATLLAGVLAAGTIAEGTFTPSWTASRDAVVERVTEALDRLGTGWHRREHTDGGVEVVPDNDAAVLGRALVAAGAPQGAKSGKRPAHLPAAIFERPCSTQAVFVEVYLLGRATTYDDKDALSIRTARPQSFREDVAELVAQVAGESVTASESSVTVSAAAARALGFGRDGPFRQQ